MPDTRHHNLSILLLKDNPEPFQVALKEDSQIKTFNIKRGSQEIGTLFVRSSSPNPPRWASFFKDFINIEEIGVNKTVAAALLVKKDERTFAITFGQGRYLLKPDIWVERFGLKVALNTIASDKIKTIDKTTFDAISRHSKEQASREADARDFGIDIEQDLLRAVTGIPKSPKMGKRIYGMDSLSVSTGIRIENLESFLEDLHLKFSEESYKVEFPWVDHISEVRDDTVTRELDTLLISHIVSANFDKLWMAVPEFIDWDQVSGFSYKMGPKSPEYQDIHLKDFLDSLNISEKENVSKETFTKKYVRCIHSEGYVMKQWQAYKCLYCELERESGTYLLSGGKWYNVQKDFVESVNESFDEIPNYEVALPTYDDDSEGQYNERVSEGPDGDFALMHKKTIICGGGRSQIEFCDLLSKGRDIIHVKHYGNSSLLSHFLAQGRLSGELFQMEREFRKRVDEKLPVGFKIESPEERPKSDSYRVVYAIISDVPGDLNIPFFSKLNLKNSARNLRGLGYRVAKAKIQVESGRARFKKYRKKRKSKVV